MPETKKTAGRKSTKDRAKFTADEIDAMKERAKELKASGAREDGEASVLAKLAEMPAADRAMAERIHALVKAAAPELESRTWYGMPAYTKGGKIVCFFKAASKFATRYATFGFEETARLDDGSMWATSWAITKLSAADEAKLSALVKQAAG